MKIDQFKSHFYAGREFINFNNSGQALIPDSNRDKAFEWLERFYREGAFCALEAWGETEKTREKLADFIGADSDEVSFFQTTASALSQIALSLPLASGDEILTWDQEYPSNFYPWRMAAEKSGATLIQIESVNWQTPARKILERVTKKTKVIAISWVQYQTGSVTDLKELSRALKGSGIWLVADVIQGVGVRPLNFHDTGFDAICGGSHKWLCSSYGAAFMAIKKSRLEELAPREVGAMTYGTPDTEKNFTIQPKTDARRFEPGSKPVIEVIAMGASLDLFTQYGIEEIFKEASRLGERLQMGLSGKKFKIISAGPITNFYPAEISEIDKIIKKLNNAQVSFARRGPGIRLSVHAYNHDSEIDRILNLLN